MSTYGYQQHTTLFFFFNDTATTEIYTLSLHDALPISYGVIALPQTFFLNARHQIVDRVFGKVTLASLHKGMARSEEHTSELQSQSNLVCRLLLEKKKRNHLAVRHPQYAIRTRYRPH